MECVVGLAEGSGLELYGLEWAEGGVGRRSVTEWICTPQLSLASSLTRERGLYVVRGSSVRSELSVLAASFSRFSGGERVVPWSRSLWHLYGAE